MEGFFDLNPSPEESLHAANWPPAQFGLPSTSSQRSRDGEIHPSMLDTFNVLQYDPDDPGDDEYVDAEEAGALEEGETVLRLGRKSGAGSSKKKRPPSSQRLLSEAHIDEEGKMGRRKIQIEYIQDKSRRHITFSKRKAGIMKKAYELSTLTGTQVLLLVVSENGTVFTYTTDKLQPLVTEPAGKNLIRECLDAHVDSSQSTELKHGGHVALKTKLNKKGSASNLKSPRRADPPPPVPLPENLSNLSTPLSTPSFLGNVPAYANIPPELYQPLDYGQREANLSQMGNLYYPTMTSGELYPGQYIPTTEGAYM